MRRSILILLLATSFILVLAVGKGTRAEDMSVAFYIQLTVARLQLAKDTWEREGRSPSEVEEGVLLQRYSTTKEEYYAFRSIHRVEVDGYLAAHPEIQAEIESLGARIDGLINQAEAQ